MFTSLLFILPLGILMLISLAFFAASFVSCIIKSVKSVKSGRPAGAAIPALALLSFVISAAFLFNFGWIRTVITWMGIPLVKAALTMRGCAYAAHYADRFPKVKLYSLLLCAVNPLFFMLLPDFGDIGPSAVFFTLIKRDAVIDIFLPLAISAGVAYLVILILLFKAIGNARGEERAQKSAQASGEIDAVSDAEANVENCTAPVADSQCKTVEQSVDRNTDIKPEPSDTEKDI